MIGIEHKNDILVGKSRISKSSGRLWISGVNKSLKRMSAPERDIPLTGSVKYNREPRPNTFTENGFVPHVDENDDLDDIIEDLQDFHQSISSEKQSLSSKPESPRSGNLTLPRDSKILTPLPKTRQTSTEQNTKVQTDPKDTEPVILFCSHL